MSEIVLILVDHIMILRTSEWSGQPGTYGTAVDVSMDEVVSPRRSNPVPSWENIGRAAAASFFVENSLIVIINEAST